MNTRQFCTNKPGHKIYRCIPAWFTWHYTRLHNPKILHTKTFFAPACHLGKKISSETKMWQSSIIHPRLPHMSSPTSIYDSNTNFSKNISLFPYLVLVVVLGLGLCLGLGLGLGLLSNQPPARNRYISLHATTWVTYFFKCVICKYYNNNKDGVLLDNTYSYQVFHTNEDRVLLGNPIQDSQHKILSSIIKLKSMGP